MAHQTLRIDGDNEWGPGQLQHVVQPAMNIGEHLHFRSQRYPFATGGVSQDDQAIEARTPRTLLAEGIDDHQARGALRREHR